MSDGQKLYELWVGMGTAYMDSWDQLSPELREDWDRFAEVLVVDRGLQL